MVPAFVTSPLAALRSRLGLPPLPPPPSKCAHKLAHAPRLHARRGGREAADAVGGGRQPTPRLDARRGVRQPTPSPHTRRRARGGREAANATLGAAGRRATRLRFQAEQSERSLSLAAPNLAACCELCEERNRMLTEAKSPLLRCGYFHYADGLCHMAPEPPLAVRAYRMADLDRVS